MYSIQESTEQDFACEKVKTRHWDWTIGDYIYTCFMDETTRIDVKDVAISTYNENVQGLLLEHNQNIRYLPIKVHENFPNLLGISAFDCKIEEISKANFEKLTKLTEIHLHNNKIKVIYADTFEDLTALQHIFLGKMNINQNLVVKSIINFRSEQNQENERRSFHESFESQRCFA